MFDGVAGSDEAWWGALVEDLPHPVAVARVDPSDPRATRYVYANAAARREPPLGFPDSLGKPLREHAPRAHGAPGELDHPTTITTVSRTGEARVLDLVVYGESGGADVYKVHYFRIGDGVVGATFENLLERRAMEAESALARLRLRAIFRKSPIALLEEDLTELYAKLERFDGVEALGAALDEDPSLVASLADEIRVLGVNEAALAFFGAEEGAQSVAHIERALASSSPARLRRQLLALAAGERNHVEEYDFERLDGSHKPGRMTLRVERQAMGGVRGWAAIQDLTELTEAHARLAQQAAQLAASNTDLERFAHIASHDLREPLRMIASFAELLKMEHGDALEGDAQDYLGFLIDGAERMRRLLEDLLLFSRVISTQVGMEPVDPLRAMRSARDNLRVALLEADAEVALPDALPRVLGSGPQLERVFQNLFANAIRFRSHERPRVEVTAGSRGEQLVVRVTDNGIGFDPRHAEEIFDVFRRLNARDEHSGTGMGLAICKRVLEQLGGEIHAESAPGEGATFVVALQLADPRREPTG